MTDRVLVAARVTAGFGLLSAGAAAVLLPTASWFVFDGALVLLGLGLVLGATALWLCLGRAAPAWVGTCAGTVIGAMQAVVSLAPYGWDAGRVRGTAQTLARGAPLDPDQLEYLARYPNNLPLVAAEEVAAKVADWSHLPLAWLLLAWNVALLAVTLQAVGVAVAAFRRRAVLPAQAAVTVLISASPAMAVPYSDLPAMAGATVSVALVAVAGSGGLRRWALAGAALGLAVALKPFAGALAAAAVVAGGRRHIVSTGAACAAMTATAAVMIVGAPVVTGVSHTRLGDAAPAFPARHYLAMGTHDVGGTAPTRRYGSYSQAQVDATAGAPTIAARDRMLRDTIRRQVVQPDFPAFVSHKIAWIWGDGTFWAQGEGSDARQPSRWTGTVLASTAAVTRGAGPGYVAKASLVQGLWVALLVWLGVGLVRRPRAAVGPLVTAIAVAALVQTAYLAAFEARPRYLLFLVPSLVIAAALVTPWRSAPRPRLT